MNQRKETIEVRNLSTGYIGKKDDVVVARDINASLYSGELTCLLGPNGAGKSTLLKTLSAFIPSLKGKIIIGGKPLSDYADAEIARIISVVLTERLGLDNMTVEELIGLGRSPYTGFWGRMTQKDREIVDESISLVSIESLRNRIVSTLSDGERQKVMIAKSLAQETPVIFLDEPTAFLDYPSKVEIMQLLQRLARRKGKTVFLSTHDLELALQIADKVWLVDKNLGVAIGTPEDLALAGEINRYFKRTGVCYDVRTGQFKISYEERAKMVLKGSGCRYEMVRKALARNGIGVCSSEDSDIPDFADGRSCPVIEVDEKVYRINDRPVSSIEELLEAVNSAVN